ncbi:MAG: PduL/EutD family phosphate acyltransferase, partial [Armatimonadota bacterium]|nr:PduL/EutD family phosphate acyltransferase [Armatimonadota bacterium]
MDDRALIRAVTEEVLRQLSGARPFARPPSHIIPVGVSARHCHLATEHLAALFGAGQSLTPRNWLYQPGQFAAEQTVTLVGPRGVLEHV